jgi:methylglutaconyl-CoA hydratase
MAMTYRTLEIERRGSAEIIWLNRPDVRNAFDEVMIEELHDAVRKAGADKSVRALVLAARGPVFCAGADLKWMERMAGFSRKENLADAQQLARLLSGLYRFPKPTLARVHGDCFAGGVGLVSACDIVLAAREARFCLTEVRIGLIPATVSPYVLRALGERLATRYMLSAERFGAEEAQRGGLVHACVDSGVLDAELDKVLAQFDESSPHAVEETKRLIREVSGRPIDAGVLDDTAEMIADARASDDGKEGVRAFLEKRKPSWSK